jgi:hypothetical protein
VESKRDRQEKLRRENQNGEKETYSRKEKDETKTQAEKHKVNTPFKRGI